MNSIHRILNQNFFSAFSTLLIISCTANSFGQPPLNILNLIKLPPGFKISIYSDQTPNARGLTLGDDGTVYVGSGGEGKVYALVDKNNSSKADRTYTIATGLNNPIGVAFKDGDLYVSEISRIIKFKAISTLLDKPPKAQIIYNSYPKEAHHGGRYIRFGPDNKLYVSVGVPCNVCLNNNEIYGTITRMDKDGNNFEIFAKGIRNSVGFDWHPKTKELWFTDNGRDWLGDDTPPDELNQAASLGMHFGFPFCHGIDILDPKFGKLKNCKNYTAPAWSFPAHVAALGIRFYSEKKFPSEYQEQLFVAQHGSWNRSIPQGYRIMALKFENGKPAREQVFAEGWLRPNGVALGRPVDVLPISDGSLLISDDKLGVVYRITYEP